MKENNNLISRENELITVRDKQGKEYSMPSQTSEAILNIDYNISYLLFEVQEVIDTADGERYLTKELVVLFKGHNPVDLIAVEDIEIGEIVK